MALNTTGKTSIFKDLSRLAAKHNGGINMSNKKYQKKLREYKRKSDAKLQRYVNKQFYLQHIFDPFIHYSIFDDDELKRASFKNYNTDFSRESALNYHLAVKFANQYISGKKFNSIFAGPCGRGKSHLALSVLKTVLKVRQPMNSGIFMDVNEMMQKIKNGFDEHTPVKARIEKRLAHAYLIVLDDLGAENISKFDREILLEIINSNHRIIFTTNLMPKQITEKYGGRISSRIQRGIRGHMALFTDKTKDYRIYG